MKQFSLEEYLENPSKRIVTRDGRNVRIICTDFDNPDYPIIGGIKGSIWPCSFATNGLLVKGNEHPDDLFFASKKHEGWINLYKTAQDYIFPSYIYQTKEDAEKYGIDNDCYITTIKIEWEE